MKYIKPKKLKKGNTTGMISPASAPNEDKLIESGVRYIEKMGYRTLPGKNVEKVRGYLAGTDDERVEDIHQMFGDKKVKAIFCLRGGYGAFRLLDKIDYKLIKNNPKIFIGFSEITALHMAFLQKAKLISFAGPMVLPNFSTEVSSFTEENFWSVITSTKKNRKINLVDNEVRFENGSRVNSGIIIGGNLSVFTALLGTGFLPDLTKKILLLEEISEPPYKIDRMLNQLRLNNVFKNVNGIILGNFLDCYETDKHKKTLSLSEVLVDYFKQLNIPVIQNFPFGHSKNILTLPIGAKVKIDLRKGMLELSEAGVR
jgi:muramoyltetrapeptide carboxypeptidase